MIYSFLKLDKIVTQLTWLLYRQMMFVKVFWKFLNVIIIISNFEGGGGNAERRREREKCSSMCRGAWEAAVSKSLVSLLQPQARTRMMFLVE